ncbi:Cytochrome P450 [Penicillium chermesinum]|uniref:Cytochrome P450 n=1 Tax=Penicillium chermesinum TaxID=63820 RepID=A0A9W9NIG0_9EURO|nr:Cytochrome P450 [Penicillium chermesinum]KAJ5220570.1 Cytochrome P450 [Penicillium chermesinum]
MSGPKVSELPLGLALSAIHTDLLFKTIGRIAAHPDVLPELRSEIEQAISVHGLNKNGVYNMKRLDSVLKETQHLNAVALAIMNRDKTYDRAKEWDPYRFHNIRRTGQEQEGQLVSTTAQHLAFGLEKHACPGRIFAAHELKIMLAHILLKYDIEYIEQDRPKIRVVGTDVFADGIPRAQVGRRDGYKIPIVSEAWAD